MNGVPRPRDAEDALRILVEISRAFQPAAALAAGVELGLFGALARGPRSSEELARALDCSPRGTRILAEALAAIGLLRRRGTRYEVPAVWRPLLDPRSASYAGGRFAHARDSLVRWSRLAGAVRSGKPVADIDSAHGAGHFFGGLVPALFAINRPDAREAARLLGLGRLRRPFEALDLAAGSAVWGIEAARANPRVRVTAVDFPKILSVARRFARREGTGRQFRFLGGDIRRLDFGNSRFDLAILGLVCHQFPERENLALFRKLHRALAPGGRVLLVEFAPYDDRSGPEYPVVFGLNMLLATREGEAYSRGEYCALLDRAGFSRFRLVDRPSGLTLLFASKA